jgi:hypothetical protein
MILTSDKVRKDLLVTYALLLIKMVVVYRRMNIIVRLARRFCEICTIWWS